MAGDAFTLHGAFPNYFDALWVAYSYDAILERMPGDGVAITSTVLCRDPAFRAPHIQGVVPWYLLRFLEPFIKDRMAWLERRLLRRVAAGDVAYLWLGSPPDLCDKLHARGVMVLREMINCTLAKRREVLTQAHAQLGLPALTAISDAAIDQERKELLAVDAVFCPNPLVKQSLLEYGVAEERCIDASFGWDPQRLAGESRIVPAAEGFTLAFVGTLDVRKGVPWLLEAWVRAGVKGRLLLAGWLDPLVAERCADLLAREDVVWLDYVADVGSVYRAADAFVFPSWEEGGPLVTLEAMALGRPCIVTPMGSSGAFAADEEIGVLVPPGDIDALAQAIRQLAQDGELRSHLAARARERAQEYRWERVVDRRKAALIQQRRHWMGEGARS